MALHHRVLRRNRWASGLAISAAVVGLPALGPINVPLSLGVPCNVITTLQGPAILVAIALFVGALIVGHRAASLSRQHFAIY